MKVARILLVTLLCLASGASARDGDEGFERGNNAYLEKNYKEAVVWWSQAAEAGHPRAKNGLGLLYHDGKGVAKDETRAFTLFRESAEAGFAYAMYNLALAYRNGAGTAVDDIEARKWFVLAGTVNFDQKALFQRDLIERRMTPDQIAESNKRAQAWLDRFLFGTAQRQ